ncbi:molybdopterin synthase subunit MoaE [Salinisphaera dokdonensis CL-ES53]|uniref:Molybdopterin synthase catalytic subunit n=1 Tax=Salinisphaera dokdonensis CL-ES53 TaxID=1304272 RepID=A0ABV2AX23_9GAMM
MSETIRVTVECFGELERLMQAESVTVDVDAPHTSAELIVCAQRQYPAAADLLSRTACARGDRLLAATDTLAENDTVALIPPVSGGQPASDSHHLTDAPLDLDALMDETADDECGALVVFGGTVRLANNGREVASMDYSAYGPLAARTIADIEAETIERFDVSACRIQHRTGRLGLGAVSVYIVVRAVHRAAAFDAARNALEELKARVAVWKNEHYADGSSAYLEGTEVVQPERPRKP